MREAPVVGSQPPRYIEPSQLEPVLCLQALGTLLGRRAAGPLPWAACSAKSGLHPEGGLRPPLADKADSLPVLLWGAVVELHRTDGSHSPRDFCELAAATERNCNPCAPAAPAERNLNFAPV